jgi:hypothetical protein
MAAKGDIASEVSAAHGKPSTNKLKVVVSPASDFGRP